MGIVVNDVVKMEWQENRFLQSKGAGRTKVFVLACKDYETTTGIVPVFFNTESAWILEDEVGLFEFADVKEYLANNNNPMFPESMEECFIIADVYGNIKNDAKIDAHGLRPFMDDILRRIKDVAPYAEEKEVKTIG